MQTPPSKTLARAMSGIQWTTFTLNPWIGCTRLAGSHGAPSGCDICYAATYAENRLGLSWGSGAARKRVVTALERAKSIDRAARATGLRFAVFALSLGDWLDPEVDPSWRAEFLEIVERCDAVDWLLLTHRPHLARKLAPAAWLEALPAHVWPGVTVDHRNHAFRWHQMRDVWGGTGRAWISAEPLFSSLAGVDLDGAAALWWAAPPIHAIRRCACTRNGSTR